MTKLDLYITDKYLSHQISLLRFTAGEQNKTLVLLKQMQVELKAKLRSGLTDFSKARINKVLKEAKGVIDGYYAKTARSLDSHALAKNEAKFTTNTFAGIGLDASLPSEAALKALVNGSLIEGAQSSAWWARQSEDLSFKFANQVRQGIVQNETLQQIIRRVAGSKRLGIPGIMDVSRRNASALVHTSIMQVANDARLATFRANDDIIKGMRFLATLDSHTSLTCIAHSGAEWTLDGEPMGGTTQPFASPPLHFNCLPGNAVVSAAGVSKHYKRWFDGEVVVLSITGIDDITITPNHPVLTDHGWVKSGLLKQGDNLVLCDDPEAVVSAINPNNNYVETSIEDIGNSLVMSGRMSAMTVPTAAKDFHGDGIIDNKVNIILSDGLFSDKKQIGARDKQIKDESFTLRHTLGISLPPKGTFAKMLKCFDLSSCRSISSGSPGSSGLCPSTGSLKGVSFRNRTDIQSKSQKHISYNSVMMANPHGNIFSRLASHIFHMKLPDFIIRKNLSALNRQRQAGESVSDGMTAVSDSLGEMYDRFSSHISFVKLNNVTVKKYSSHVYNLQSDFNWYIVSMAEPQKKSKGIIVHNCRSMLVPITLSYRELGIDVDKPKGTRASDLGQIPSDTTFDGFLKRHDAAYADDLLGPGRAKLWRDGKITLSDLLGQTGRPLTLEQLKKK